MQEIKLSEAAVRAIEQILNRRHKVEIGVRNGKLCIWEVKSKTEYEQPSA